MFESVEMHVDYPKQEYENDLQERRLKLFQLQQKVRQAGLPVIVLIAGIPGSGRGAVVNLLNEWMDARYLHNETFWMETEEQKERPVYWRYWMALPPRGQTGVFFGGWYEKPVVDLLDGTLKEAKFEQAMNEVNRFEQMLTSDGTLIIKLWLHLSKDGYKDIMKKRNYKGDPLAYESNASYGAVRQSYAQAIRLTDTGDARWYLINARHSRYRNITILDTLIENIQMALAFQEESASVKRHTPPSSGAHYLDSIDLSVTLGKKEYSEKLDKYQRELTELTLEAFKKKLSVVILFEGWDAAGKGGAIRRLTAAVDARIRQTIPIASPTDEEKAHHYLWRFWRQIPRAGFMTIYDRTWYGRVLVERVEGFASPEAWSRAYEEINEFERQLIKGNILALKFWLHISQEEQLNRFKERESTELKRHKITSEDWRNREKAPAYMEAIDDMFAHTNTDIAPWHIIPGNDKYYARVEVIKTVCKELKEKLKKI